MISSQTNRYFARRDVLLLTVLIFVIVIILVGYEAINTSKIDTQDITIDTPPVLIKELDTSIFERLETMTE